MYGYLFAYLGERCTPGSALAELLEESTRPIHDAVPLRLAGSVHREVLTGSAAEIRRHYPSVAGSPGHDFPNDFLEYLVSRPEFVLNALATQVQTNEVRRSIVLRQAMRWLPSRGIADFNVCEVGCSAGLNLLFDLYPDVWFEDLESNASANSPFPADAPRGRILDRAGCDLHPLNVRDADDMTRLRSFVWPDQTERLLRLNHAIDIAATSSLRIERASADDWVERQLSSRNGPTVVFHSIVWQYLGAEVQTRFRQALVSHGRSASAARPLIWIRMEPNGAMADVRATVWDGSDDPSEYVLADVGYHGESFRWHDLRRA